MIKKSLLLGFSVVLLSSCVSKKIYNDLEKNFEDLKAEKALVDQENTDLSLQKNQLELDKNALQTQLDKLKAEYAALLSDCNTSKSTLKNLQGAYDALEKSSNASIQANSEKNRDLLAQLQSKEKALQAEQDRLEKLKNDLGNNEEGSESGFYLELKNASATAETALQAYQTENNSLSQQLSHKATNNPNGIASP